MHDWIFDPGLRRWIANTAPAEPWAYTYENTDGVTITLPESDPSLGYSVKYCTPSTTTPKEGPMATSTVKLVVKFTNGDTEDFAAAKHYASDGLVTLQDAKGVLVTTLNQDQVRSITPVSELEAPEVTHGAHVYTVQTLKGEVTVKADTYTVKSHNSDDAVFYTFTTTLPSGQVRQEASFPAQSVTKVLRVDGVPAQREDARV